MNIVLGQGVYFWRAHVTIIAWRDFEVWTANSVRYYIYYYILSFNFTVEAM